MILKKNTVAGKILSESGVSGLSTKCNRLMAGIIKLIKL